MLVSRETLWHLFLLLMFFALKSVKSDTEEKYVSAKVYTKWSETPIALEASEYIFKYNRNSFWNFVYDIANDETNTLASCDAKQSIYENVIDKAKKYLNELELNLLKLSLSIRAYSPAIEASRKLAQEAKSNCITFIDVHGKTTCDLNEIVDLIKNADVDNKPFIYKFDKMHPETSPDGKIIVILYSNIASNEFKQFDKKILDLYKTSSISFTYLLRHNSVDNKKRISLSGYGVELDVKNTEYKAKDDTKVNEQDGDNIKMQQQAEDEGTQGFNFNKLKSIHPQLEKELDEFRKYLIESTQELAPLKAWHLQDLSIQAAQYILETDPSEQLNTLIDISQNFPLRARSLSKISVKKDMRSNLKAHKQNFETSLNVEAGTGGLYINGLEINLDTVDIFSLTTQLIKEAKLLENLYKIGLQLDQIKEVIYFDLNSKSLDYGIDIRDSSIQWVNDLENDKKYSYWPKSLQEILRPTYPGMLRSIAKNFFNLVIVVDPSKNEARSLLKTLESFYVNDIPIRIGLVFVTNNDAQADGFKDASVALFRAHNYIKQKSNAPKALSFLTDLYAKAPKDADLTSEFVVKEFKRAYPKEKNYDDVFGVDSDYDEGRKLSMEYYNKIGLRKLPQVLINGFPLKEQELENDIFEESVIQKIMQLTQEIQLAYYHGRLHEGHSLIDWLMNKDVIMPRLNPRILSNQRNFIEINEFDEDTSNFINDKKYLTYMETVTDLSSLSLWIVCDPDTEKGRKFLSDAIDFHESSSISRISIFFQSENESNNLIKKAIDYAINNFDNLLAKIFIKKILKEKLYNDLKNGKKRFSDIELPKELDIAGFDEKINDLNIAWTIKEHGAFIKKHLKFESPENIGLVANGWILGPLQDDEVFIDSDFVLLDNFMRKTGLNQMKDNFQKWYYYSRKSIHDFNNVLMNTYAILGKYAGEEKRTKVSTPDSGYIHIKPKNPDLPFFDAIVVLDPLTRFAQRVSPIVKVLSESTNVNLAVYFNCRDKISGVPLKNFYRYVLEPEMKFKDGVFTEPLAYFHNMPQTPLLTMNMHPPEGWMVEIVRSPFDLDNIYLKEVETRGAYGEYELEHLLIEGHCFDMISGQSPRGLQFNLGTSNNPKIYDTIVMANLGYFQLKSTPGSWILQLREGRSKDIYEIVSHENTDSLSRKSATVTIVMDTFESKIIKIKVSKKADKMNENLLDDKEEESGGIWSSISNTFGGGSGNKEAEENDEDNVLNIFSVASGHLYERFLRIMMLTVLKNTKARVKFWFLKNYLSPQLTKFLPYYAEKYNFDYELVQYKWPRWLHHETEKQRIIWGYKILFLDVLFPLNVKKIIFVDADQIVRADLTELRDIDLKGAPYGYTPFCDSRKEMEGYRFWKTGYWSMHLGHRKYHISALYVVDLKKFRKIAAGDRLRGQYQGLSQDPNSLSNLDQDLPNNMIHQVNIFSLPQEWLYCDTWCSSDTLKKAKTIDLCNNPMTKEPKLEAAVRIVPEWKDYDNEIKDLIEKWQQELKQNSSEAKTPTSDSDKHTEL